MDSRDGKDSRVLLEGGELGRLYHSLGSGLTDTGFDSIALQFAQSHDQCGLSHRQLAALHSLDYVQSFLVFYRQGCHPATLT